MIKETTAKNFFINLSINVKEEYQKKIKSPQDLRNILEVYRQETDRRDRLDDWSDFFVTEELVDQYLKNNMQEILNCKISLQEFESENLIYITDLKMYVEL